MPLRLIVVKKLCRSNSIGSSTRLLSLTIMYYFLHKIQSIRQKISLSKTAILIICFSHFNFVVHSTEIRYFCLMICSKKNASKFAIVLDYEILCRLFFTFCYNSFFVSIEHISSSINLLFSEECVHLHYTNVYMYVCPALQKIKILSILNLSSHFSYKNGSVTRERIRNEVAEGNWDLFNQLLDSTPRGNFGNIGKHMRDNRVNIIFQILILNAKICHKYTWMKEFLELVVIV